MVFSTLLALVGLTALGSLASPTPGVSELGPLSTRKLQKRYPNPGTVTGDTSGVHDPSVCKVDGTYYLYSTGIGIPIRTSTDRIAWTVSLSMKLSVPDPYYRCRLLERYTQTAPLPPLTHTPVAQERPLHSGHPIVPTVSIHPSL